MTQLNKEQEDLFEQLSVRWTKYKVAKASNNKIEMGKLYSAMSGRVKTLYSYWKK
ncbi:MAG: hypothetical protein Q7R52_02420 [archaeon]|nr:hypothetical protein [archaeon]